MAIAGNLSSMPLEDLLGWIATSGQTGTLVIDGPSSSKRLVIEHGVLTATASSDPEESLSRFLIGWGMVAEEQLERLFVRRDQSGTLVGQQLIAEGLLAESDLVAVLTVVAREVVSDAFSWAAGSFRFLDGVVPEHRFHPLAITLTPLTLEGARRVDERRRMSEVIPTVHHRPRRTSGIPAGGLTLADLSLITDLDGELSFADLADARREPAFTTMERFHPAVRRGVVEVLAPQPGAARHGWSSSLGAQLLRASVSLANGRLVQAARIVADLTQRTVDQPALSRRVAPLAAEVERGIAAAALPPTAVLEVAIPREELFQLQCGPVEGFILSRVDGHSSVAEILKQVPGDDAGKHFVLLDLVDRGVLAARRPTRAEPDQRSSTTVSYSPSSSDDSSR